jgi:hypothetical protein
MLHPIRLTRPQCPCRVRAAAVCKAWNQLLQRPDMWTSITLPRCRLLFSGQRENDGAFRLDALHWLTSRCRSTRSLTAEVVHDSSR